MRWFLPAIEVFGSPLRPEKEPSFGRQRRSSLWRWRARSSLGEPKAGEAEAETREDVEERLRTLGLVEIRVRRAFFAVRLPDPTWWVSRRERSNVRQILRTMGEAGLPLDQAMEIVEAQSSWPVARRLRAARAALASGAPVEHAFAASRGLLEPRDALAWLSTGPAAASPPRRAAEAPPEPPTGRGESPSARR